MEDKKSQPTRKDFERPKTYEFTLLFKDGHHTVLHVLTFFKRVNPTDPIYSAIEEPMMKQLQAMDPQWPGYGLWLQHEPVTRKYIFADVAYLVRGNQLVFDVENHSCQYRSIQTPVIQYDECAVCLETRDPKVNWSSLACMHLAVCPKCMPSIHACVICGRRKKIE